MSEEAGRLHIHVRRVVWGDGTLTAQNEVYCPPRDRTVGVGTCEACDDYAGADLDPATGRRYVLCRRLTPESARSLRSARNAFIRRRCLIDPRTPGERTQVSTVMRDDVVCVREELPLDALRALLLERRINGAPVVNDAGEPIGVVSERDLLRAPEAARVRDVMIRLTFVVPESATVSQAAALMAYEGLHWLPVISDDGKVVGLLSSTDVLRWLARSDGYLTPDR